MSIALPPLRARRLPKKLGCGQTAGPTPTPRLPQPPEPGLPRSPLQGAGRQGSYLGRRAEALMGAAAAPISSAQDAAAARRLPARLPQGPARPRREGPGGRARSRLPGRRARRGREAAPAWAARPGGGDGIPPGAAAARRDRLGGFRSGPPLPPLLRRRTGCLAPASGPECHPGTRVQTAPP